jgi:Astacin (Peptidase family M12A)
MADPNIDLPPGMFRSGTVVKKTRATMARHIKGVLNVDLEYTELGQHAIFEGDIVLATLAEVEAAERAADSKGIGIIGANFRWPGGRVPFVIANEGVRTRVLAAIEHWQTRTPFKFTPRVSEPDFVSFDALDGCFSRVGRQGGMQVISIGTGCEIGSAVHEIGHVLGLWHEQSRSDRDDFVKIVSANIDPRFKSNFAKHILDGEDLGPYDHGSIMHYPATAFSVNGQPTIVTKNGESIGQRNGLSKGDITAMRLMYSDLDWTPFPTA